jgi:Na+/melibiose symporter-like transporter
MMLAQAIGLLFPGTLYPLIGTDKKLWFFTMLGISLLVLPFTLLQYFHTRERITEESNTDDAAAPKVPLKKQLSVVFKDRYWWIIILYTFIFQLGLALKNSSVAYYCNWVIGAKYNDGYTMLAFIQPSRRSLLSLRCGCHYPFKQEIHQAAADGLRLHLLCLRGPALLCDLLSGLVQPR